MKKHFFFILMLGSIKSYSQISIDTGVIGHYNHAINNLKPEYCTKEMKQNKLEIEKRGDVGFCIFTSFKSDTLNKNEALKDNHFAYPRLMLIDGTKDLTYANFMSMGYNDNDTLKINLPILLPSIFPNIYQKVINGKVNARMEYIGADTSVMLNLKQKPSDYLYIPSTALKYTLSTSDYTIGNAVYGEAEIVTDPYYVNNGGFKTGYIYQRIHCKYVFKFPIIKKPF